jgi:hypothetical protein
VPARLFNSLYFMYPNASIRDFAFEVVGIHKTDSNDVKMGKIARWVQRHILYREDLPNYGYESSGRRLPLPSEREAVTVKTARS